MRRLLVAGMVGLSVLTGDAPLGGPRAAQAGIGPALGEAGDAITAMDVERARKLLEPLDAATPAVSFELARLAMAVGDCDEAVKRLSPERVQALRDAGPLLVVALGCQRATAATAWVEDKEHATLVRLQDEGDRALVPLIGETVARQREVLKRDLGVVMPLPTRVDLVRDQFTLAAMTGLPHRAAQTTGTVAIAKFGRVIMLSPRAPSLGYSFRDTLAHELTHLALTRGSLDRAPLWLQEGVAKREETRWRPPTPTDDAIPPDAVAAVGLAKGLGRPLDGIGPSVALLPTAQEAMVVYAEVTSFVRFLAGDRAGSPGAPTDTTVLPRMLEEYAKGLDTDGALKAVTGKDLKAWNEVWRPWVTARAAGVKLPPGLGLDAPGHKAARPLPSGAPPAPPSSPAVDPARDPARDPALEEEAKKNGRALRDQARAFRIGELLLGRGHVKAARAKLDPVIAKHPGDPLIGSHAAAARLADGDAAGALALLDPTTLTGDLGGWWAQRALALVATGGTSTDIGTSWWGAMAHDPLGEPAACGWADWLGPSDPMAGLARGVCAAAKDRHLPKPGQD